MFVAGGHLAYATIAESVFGRGSITALLFKILLNYCSQNLGNNFYS